MPERETMERAEQDQREGKAPTTQAGELIREEMHHIREGKHGARSGGNRCYKLVSQGGRQIAAAEGHQRGRVSHGANCG